VNSISSEGTSSGTTGTGNNLLDGRVAERRKVFKWRGVVEQLKDVQIPTDKSG
jgi:hypothetical protein